MANRSRTRSSLRASNTSFIVSTDLGSHQQFILEEMLLSGEWRDIKDIIKVSIKALSEIVKTQSTSIRDLERQMAMKVGKNELEFQLASMGGNSIKDSFVIPRRHQLAGDMPPKGILPNNSQSITMDTLKISDLQAILKDFVSVSELQYELSSRVTIQEVRQLLHPKVPQEHKHDFNLLRARVDDVQRETELYVTRKELENVLEKLDSKADKIEMEEKASKSSVSTALQRKANKSEVEEIKNDQESQLTEILDIIKNKADKRELEIITEIAAEVDEIRRQVEMKDNNDKDILESLQRDIEQIKKEISVHQREMDLTNREVDSVKREIDQAKREIDGVKRETENIKTSTQPRLRELQEFSRRLEEQFQESKCDRSLSERLAIAAVTEQTNKITSSQQEEIEQLSLEVNLLKEQYLSQGNQNTQQFQILDGRLHQQGNQWSSRLQDEITSIKKDIAQNQKELVRAMVNKVDLQEVQAALNVNAASVSAGIMEHKEDVNRVINTLKAEIVSSKKQNNYDILDHNTRQYSAQIATLAQQIDSLAQEINNNCLKNTTFQQHLLQTKAALDAVQLDMSNKCNFSDLLSSKSEIEIIHRTLREIYKELSAKAFQDDLSNVINDQAIINESLCTENIVGRWTWKSHNLKQGNLIPWESQIANTLPDNFLWEKDKSHVQCVTPGLYQVCFGFYCGRRPNVKLLVNGELALSSETIQTASKFSGTLHGERNISGLTLTDFLVLAERSRISLIFEGEHQDAEGFLGLKRL